MRHYRPAPTVIRKPNRGGKSGRKSRGSRGLPNSAFPVTRLPTAVSDSDHPKVVSPNDIEQRERELFQSHPPDAWQAGHGRKSFRVGSDGVKAFGYSILKPIGPNTARPLTIEGDRLVKFDSRLEVEFDNFGSGRHLHLFEGLECLNAFGFAGIHFLNAPPDLLTKIGV